MLAMYMALIDDESDKEKFERLYNTYKETMKNIAMSILHNRALVDETVQDCFLKLAEMIKEIPDVPSKSAKAMIITMVKNKARNNLKAEHYDRDEILEEDEISDKAINDILSNIGYEELVKMINNLEPLYRDVLVLRVLDEFSVGEVAKMLGLPYRTVETRLLRGRKNLQEKLEGIYNECSN